MNSPDSSQKTTNSWRTIRWMTLLTGCIAFAYPLLGYIITGTYARYIQDDYCYAAYLARYPFFEGQVFSYIHIDTYSGNRYSLNLLSGISELLGGRFSVQVLPGLAVVLLVIGCFLLLSRAGRLAGVRFSRLELLLAAEALTFLGLCQAPNLFQVLYWRAGMLPYLAPIITDIFLVSLALQRIEKQDSRALWLAICALLAFLAAGFSETAAAFQVGLAFLPLFVSWVLLKRGNVRAIHGVRFSVTALLASFSAMLVLIVSPINAKRLVGYPEPPSLTGFLSIAIDSSLQLLVYNAYRLTTLLVFTFIFFLLLALYHARSSTSLKHLDLRMLLALLTGMHIANFLLILCCVAPSVYFYSNTPDLRAFTAGQFTTVFAIAGSGFLMGWWWNGLQEHLQISRYQQLTLIFSAILSCCILCLLFLVAPGADVEAAFPDIRAFLTQQPLAALLPLLGVPPALLFVLVARKNNHAGNLYGLASAVFLAFLFLLPLRGVKRIYDEIPQYRQRAEIWDRRDLTIREAEKNAERRITVQALDSMYGVADLQIHPDNWLNNCAEWYYGMEWISAVEQ